MTATDSIIDKVNEIKNARMAKGAKKAALVKLGLSERDADLVMYEIRITGREEGLRTAQRFVAGAFTFGVEIECNVPHNGIREAAAVTGFRYEYQGYNHNDNMTCFKFVSDGSLYGDNPIECVSPVLKGADGKAALRMACETLSMANASVNRSCGLHVHIGAADLTDEQYGNVFANYYYLESVIDSFMAPSRRNNTFASSLRDMNPDHFNSRDSVRNELRSRYFKVNAESYIRHKTIEFRQHQGTTNYDKIINWVSFCGKLVAWSRTNRLAAPVASIDDIAFLSKRERTFFKKRAEKFAAR